MSDMTPEEWQRTQDEAVAALARQRAEKIAAEAAKRAEGK